MTLFRKVRPRRLVAIILCAAFVVAGPMQPMNVSADQYTSKYQADIDRINSELAELDAKKSELQENISEAKDAKAKEVETKQQLDQQIGYTRSEISLLEERIYVLEELMEEKEREIEDKQASIEENYELFQKRMRAMYVQDDATVLGLILGAESFSDFLTKTEMVARIADHDRNLIATLGLEREELEAAKAELEEAKLLLEEDRRRTREKEDDLAKQISQAQLRIQDMDALQQQFEADLEKTKALAAAMQSELNNIYRQIEWDKNPYVGGEMAWPLPGYYNITSDYGPRFGGSDYHTGIDISGANVYGQSIVAANAGTVKYVNWAYSPGVGYGIYLIVDHGGNTTTLYAHCSNIVVSVGDVVEKGQKIAEVGSTGWSTGPHLHFEVRQNGAHTNPKPYVMG